MRLFHHFLVAAHPCIPYSQVPIWVRDIPTYSHKYNYLMEAMLALSGSHLSIFVDDVTDSAGLYHRQNAIKGLEEAFTRWPPKAEEAHVMLATSFLLAHQAGYMPDGIVDYILSLRGCAFLSQLIVANGLEGTFSVEPDLPRVWFSMTSIDRSSLDQSLVGDALLSLSGIVHLLDASNVSRIEKAFFATLVETIQPLRVLHSQPSPEGTPNALQHSLEMGEPVMQSTASLVPSMSPESTFWESILPSGILFEIRTSPTTQYPDTIRSISALMEALHILTTWPQEDVLRLLSPSNRIGMVIMAHFGAIRTIVATLCIPEAAMKIPVKAMVECSEKIIDAVVLDDDPDGEWAKYVEWPATIIRALRCCLNQKRGASLGDVFDLLKKDPGAFREGRPGKKV
ncbi:hypothetical protein BCR34DRAFT_295634 [Clohesyomyces aquaticus]|uniref:Uncharacterized protein n=1 Tax=Clohesyomyces aquaticus TaxID=1231657 RepID=A0A1Y2AA22_9PLEO|nr:hypothetical protein BCR34DRAFT_295634 [Clohesyomyces aquaticus]